MKENFEEITLKLINNKVKFEAYSLKHSDAPIKFDYNEPIGDGDGFNGLELLLMSLSGCSATAIVYLLRKMKKNIKSLEVNAIGERSTDMPIKFKKIKLFFNLASSDISRQDFDRCVKLSENQYAQFGK